MCVFRSSKHSSLANFFKKNYVNRIMCQQFLLLPIFRLDKQRLAFLASFKRTKFYCLLCLNTKQFAFPYNLLVRLVPSTRETQFVSFFHGETDIQNAQSGKASFSKCVPRCTPFSRQYGRMVHEKSKSLRSSQIWPAG